MFIYIYIYIYGEIDLFHACQTRDILRLSVFCFVVAGLIKTQKLAAANFTLFDARSKADVVCFSFISFLAVFYHTV